MSRVVVSRPPGNLRHWTVGVIACVVAIATVIAVQARRDDDQVSIVGELLTDEFNDVRADLAGTSAGSGLVWSVVDGTFRSADGTVTATAAGPRPGLATVAFDTPPVVVSVLLSSIGPGSGVVFGLVDPDTYWSLEAAPGFGTWNLYSATAAGKTLLMNTGNDLTIRGSAIDVVRRAGRVEIHVNGQPSAASIVDEVPFGSSAGLIAGPGESGATSWSRFTAGATLSDEIASRPSPSPPSTDVVAPTSTTSTPARPPEDVRVVVLNGSAIDGLAGRLSTTLQDAGYDVAAPATAEEVVEDTVVYAKPGFEADAAEVLGSLDLPAATVVARLPTPAPTGSGTADVVVLLGRDASGA